MKEALEVYGKIDVCHMGDRFNQRDHPAWVKFQTRSGAEKAMEAMRAGIVLSHGEALRGEWRREANLPPPIEYHPDRPELDYTSRDYMSAALRAVRRSRSRARRSRSRRKKRSRSRRRRSRRRRRKSSDSSSSSSGSPRRPAKAIEDAPRTAFAIEDDPSRRPPSNFQSANEEEPNKDKFGTCPLGHGLVPLMSLDQDDGIVCDICNCKQSKEASLLRCKACAYYLCKKCVEWGSSLFLAQSKGSPLALVLGTGQSGSQS